MEKLGWFAKDRGENWGVEIEAVQELAQVAEGPLYCLKRMLFASG